MCLIGCSLCAYNHMDYFAAYGAAARRVRSPTLLAGRHLFQERAQQQIVADIVRKMRLSLENRLLDIGCGVGVLLTPLAARVREAVGVDHRDMLARWRRMGVPSNVQLVAGEWPQVRVPGKFDRVLAYSVLHYLRDSEVAQRFIDESLSCLAPGGLLLLGDIPNEDAARRLRESAAGQRVMRAYQRQRRGENTSESVTFSRLFARVDAAAPYLDDAFILALLTDLRRRGYEAYVMPQPRGLPFSQSREDLLIWRRG